MKYMLLIFEEPGTLERLPEDERNAAYGEYMAASDTPGVVGGAQLQHAQTATTVRVQDGRTLITDGPFAETKEQLGGYYIIETATLDEALQWAAKCPSAASGSIEVRPMIR